MVGGGFAAAERAYSIVEEQIDEMSQRADRSLQTAQSVINSLTDFSPITPPPDPVAPNIDPNQFVMQPLEAAAPGIPADLAVDIGEFPEIALGDGADLVTDLDSIDEDLEEIGDFEPSITAITIPEPPAPISTGTAPVAPELNGVEIPQAPTLELPALDELAQITIPEFTFPTLPLFEAEAPVFDVDLPPLSALAEWQEPAYNTEVLDEVLTTVRRMLDGQTGLPQPIEQALYERARSREDQTARQNVQQAFDTWAGRGFDMPPGMLTEQVNAAQEQAALRTNAASRDIAVEVARIAIENVRIAVAQGIAAEQTLYNIFNNGAQRSFEMARARLDAEIALYNAQVSLFNARQTAYQVEAQVFETKLRGALAELEVYKAQIDGARALSELNESKVRVYAAKIEGLKANVEIYRVQMEGAKVQSELNKNLIDAYRADVEAYRETIAARKVEFDAYEAQVRGEAAKVGIIQAQAEAFAATVRAVEAKSNVKVAKVRARVDALQARVGEFTARTQYEREKVSAQAQVAQAKVSAFTADVQRFSAELQANTSLNEAQIRSADVYLRTQLSQYEIAVKRYDSLLQTIVAQAQLQSDAIKAAGQMASQLAAGAFAAMHVQASVRGGGDINYSESRSDSVNYNTEF
jgi:hypothetical protein